jgi:single-strand DNA-binding protein
MLFGYYNDNLFFIDFIMNLQHLLILGRSTKDAEVTESKDGKKYARFSVAVNEYLGKEKADKVTFYNVLIFNKSSEKADKIKKGDMVLVEGKPEADAYVSKDGTAKANIVVYADKWKLVK